MSVRLQYVDKVVAPWRYNLAFNKGRAAHLFLKRIADAHTYGREAIDEEEMQRMARRRPGLAPWRTSPPSMRIDRRAILGMVATRGCRAAARPSASAREAERALNVLPNHAFRESL
jgi:hypothetical protein